jgi:hypothetical protein
MAHAGGHLSGAEAQVRVARPWPGRRRLPAWLMLAGWLVAGLAAPAAAQPVAAPAVRFTAFAARPLTDVAFVPRPGATLQKVQFAATARSPSYEYRGAAPLRFIDPATRAVIAEAAIPPQLGHVLLLFTPLAPSAPVADGGLRYQVAVLDDSPARHAAGTLAVVNLSGTALSGTVNDRAVTLRAGLNAAIPVGRSARMRFTTMRNQRAYQAYVGTATLGAGERALLLLFPPFYPGTFEVQARLLLDKPGATAPVKR